MRKDNIKTDLILDVRVLTELRWLKIWSNVIVWWAYWRTFIFLKKSGLPLIWWRLSSALKGPVLWKWWRQPWESICINGSISFVSHLSYSFERSIRFQQVHQLYDELDLGLKKWQDQILVLQRKATRQAEAKATYHLDSKRKKVENENRARWLHHIHLMDRSVNHGVYYGIHNIPQKL
jgi:hypothetical protein